MRRNAPFRCLCERRRKADCPPSVTTGGLAPSGGRACRPSRRARKREPPEALSTVRLIIISRTVKSVGLLRVGSRAGGSDLACPTFGAFADWGWVADVRRFAPIYGAKPAVWETLHEKNHSSLPHLGKESPQPTPAIGLTGVMTGSMPGVTCLSGTLSHEYGMCSCTGCIQSYAQICIRKISNLWYLSILILCILPLRILR
jgi:hypothetical protein